MTSGVRLLLLSVSALALVDPSPSQAQQTSIEGIVQDSATLTPLPDARIELLSLSGERQAAASSIHNGRFRLNGVVPNSYMLRVTRMGFQPALEHISVSPGESRHVSVTLLANAFSVDPVVVSASRSRQTAFDAPASVSVVDRSQIEKRHAITPLDHVRELPGVLMEDKGLNQRAYSMRGPGGVVSRNVRTLTDFRELATAFNGNYFSYFLGPTNADIERVEVVRGPASALYGPNAHRGLIHIITRSPFDSPGSTVSLAAGEREFFDLAFRHAALFDERLAYKISAEYYRGKDWIFHDPVETAFRDRALAAGASADTLLIGARDFDVENLRSNLRVDWKPQDQTNISVRGGLSRAISNIELGPLGAVQWNDFDYGYVQAQLDHGPLFANVFLNANEAGDSYELRSGSSFVDRSLFLGAQIRYESRVGAANTLQYGVDYRHTEPRTEGTISGRNEDDDGIDEIGGYLHLISHLTPELDLAAAIRVDHHNRLNDLVFSPRVGLVLKPRHDQSVRLTFNRAFSTISNDFLVADVLIGRLTPLPYGLRLVGLPEDGFTFRRDCDDGLCMRSPFSEDPGEYLAADATLLWDTATAMLQAQGLDLSGVPAPSASEVGTDFRSFFGPTFQFIPVAESSINDFPGPRRQITTTFEIGYRGLVGDRVFLTGDLYRSHIQNFGASGPSPTPNVFYERSSLEAYLADFLPAEQAQAAAAALSEIPMGLITPEQARDPFDILGFAVQSDERATFWGFDLALSLDLGRGFSLDASYSWISEDTIARVGENARPVLLNAPSNKASGALTYRNDRTGLYTTARLRAAESFEVLSGAHAGRVSSYAVVDLDLGYRILERPETTASFAALNLLDNVHAEHVGVPEVGRRVVMRLTTKF